MRAIQKLLAFVVAFALVTGTLMSTPASVHAQQEDTYNSFVTVKIVGLTTQNHTLIHEAIGKSADANIEYTCLESGVMVVRIQDSQLHARADLQNYVRNMIQEKAKVESLKFLDFHTERSEGNTKC